MGDSWLPSGHAGVVDGVDMVPPQVMKPTGDNTAGRRWRISGQVQGVGFRPFIYRIAVECGLAGTVRNDPSGVTIEAWGTPGRLDRFAEKLVNEPPPLARIDDCRSHPIDGICAHDVFRIVESDHTPAERGRVTVDSAVCDDCLREMRDPTDRRSGHALINCTNCGPRYSIVRDLPYDRPLTTMAGFAMCDACTREYRDPADRRFHAQPICCPACGPRLELVGCDDTPQRDEARAPGQAAAARGATRGPGPDPGPDPGPEIIGRAAQLLNDGKILAIKGLGGYHLACDARSEAAVRELRRRKHRDHKPLALMVADLPAARALVRLSARAEQLLTSPARPIVLGERRPDAGVAPSVAPNSHRLGVMLAYTPIQHLLFDRGLGPLVMTSANLSDEPLAIGDDEVCARLAGVCDAVLRHDRPIERAVDDSIVSDSPVGPVMIRRARGFVPEVTPLPTAPGRPGPPRQPDHRPGLCVGADLKNTVAVVRRGEAVLSQHIGDLTCTLAYERFVRTIDDLLRLFDTEPEWIACDAHPAYISTRFAGRYARRRGLELITVQHHHAHLAALMAEHGRTDRVIGLVCDGVGYGADGAAWGGEVLTADPAGFERVGRLRPMRLPGGDAAAKETGRCALSWLVDALGIEQAARHPAAARVLADQRRRTMLLEMLERDLNCPPSSGMGRLFDAAAALLGLCDTNHYEAMSGQMLESAALHAAQSEQTPSGEGLVEPAETGGPPRDEGALFELDHRPLLERLVAGIDGGEDRAALAWLFHDALAHGLAGAAARARAATGIDTVGLSGGVFCNGLLTQRLTDRLRAMGLEVLTHRDTTPNDGSIALGQATIALTTPAVRC